jgi:hypothetical protein
MKNNKPSAFHLIKTIDASGRFISTTFHRHTGDAGLMVIDQGTSQPFPERVELARARYRDLIAKGWVAPTA